MHNTDKYVINGLIIHQHYFLQQHTSLVLKTGVVCSWLKGGNQMQNN